MELSRAVDVTPAAAVEKALRFAASGNFGCYVEIDKKPYNFDLPLVPGDRIKIYPADLLFTINHKLLALPTTKPSPRPVPWTARKRSGPRRRLFSGFTNRTGTITFTLPF